MIRINTTSTILCAMLLFSLSCSKQDVSKTQTPINPITLRSGEIITIAGNGQTGFSGDGGPAINATLSDPQGLALDTLGNIYVAESGIALIRKINSSGTISILAGIANQFGNSGDGGSPTSAKVGWVTDVALDKLGNVYVTDGSSNVIRKISASEGTISTFAGTFLGAGINDQTPYAGDGGLATSAHINIPLGIVVGKTGNVYFVDAGNSVIRKIDGSSGVITTFAGNPNGNNGVYGGDGGPATAANLTNSYEVALDADENLYIAHSDANAIRRIDAATGIITTVAGTPSTTTGYSGDGGPAISGRLSNPHGLALDASGNIYIADTGNNVIRKVDKSTGVITTIAGSGPGAGYSGDGGPATSAKLSVPIRVAVDKSGVVYIVDAGNNVIRAMKE
jgi:hypothetical protein